VNPSYHIFFGFLFSIFLLFLFPEIGVKNLTMLFLAAVLIDVDHYLFYIYQKKDFNLRRAYDYFIANKKKWKEFGKIGNCPLPSQLCIFHGLEVLLVVFILSFFFNPLYFVFIGFSFHLLLDLAEQAVYSDKIKKVSIVSDFLNYKN